MSYYENQIGGGRVNNVFVGSPYQRGHGIGSFLGGLFRSVLPLLTRGAKAIGKEALRGGLHIIEDVSGNNIPFRDSLRRRAAESGRNLQRKTNEKIDLLMNGSGYNNAVSTRLMHSLTGSAPVHSVKRRKRSARSTSTKKSRRVKKTPIKKKKKKKTTKIKRGRVTKKKKRRPAKRKTLKATDIFGST